MLGLCPICLGSEDGLTTGLVAAAAVLTVTLVVVGLPLARLVYRLWRHES